MYSRYYHLLRCNLALCWFKGLDFFRSLQQTFISKDYFLCTVTHPCEWIRRAEEVKKMTLLMGDGKKQTFYLWCYWYWWILPSMTGHMNNAAFTDCFPLPSNFPQEDWKYSTILLTDTSRPRRLQGQYTTQGRWITSHEWWHLKAIFYRLAVWR